MELFSAQPGNPRTLDDNTEPAVRTRKGPSSRGWAGSYDEMQLEYKAWALLTETGADVETLRSFITAQRDALDTLRRDLEDLPSSVRLEPERGTALYTSVLARALWAATELRWCLARLELTRIADDRVGLHYTRDTGAMLGLVRRQRAEAHLTRFILRAIPCLCRCLAALIRFRCGDSGSFSMDSTLWAHVSFHHNKPSDGERTHVFWRATGEGDGELSATTTEADGGPYTVAVRELCEGLDHVQKAADGVR
ncbi:hypothetical protein EsH8_XI_000064 [Colletotrichum jinshuiense]